MNFKTTTRKLLKKTEKDGSISNKRDKIKTKQTCAIGNSTKMDKSIKNNKNKNKQIPKESELMTSRLSFPVKDTASNTNRIKSEQKTTKLSSLVRDAAANTNRQKLDLMNSKKNFEYSMLITKLNKLITESNPKEANKSSPRHNTKGVNTVHEQKIVSKMKSVSATLETHQPSMSSGVKQSSIKSNSFGGHLHKPSDDTTARLSKPTENYTYNNKSIGDFTGVAGICIEVKPRKCFGIEEHPQKPHGIENAKGVTNPTGIKKLENFPKTVESQTSNASCIDKVQPTYSGNLKSFSTVTRSQQPIFDKNTNVNDYIISVEKSEMGFNRIVTISKEEKPQYITSLPTDTHLIRQSIRNSKNTILTTLQKQELVLDTSSRYKQTHKVNIKTKSNTDTKCNSPNVRLQKPDKRINAKGGVQENKPCFTIKVPKQNLTIATSQKPSSNIKTNEKNGISLTIKHEQTFDEYKNSTYLRNKQTRKIIRPENFKWRDMTKSDNLKLGNLLRMCKKMEISSSVMALLSAGGLKIRENRNTKSVITKYLNGHRNIIINLIEIIDEIDSLPVLSSAVKCLHQILVSSNLLQETETFNLMDYMKPFNLSTLVNSISTIPSRCSHDAKFEKLSQDIYARLLSIINTLCHSKHCQNQLKRINKKTLQFLCNLLQQQLSKDMVINLLDIFKIVCYKRKNCRFLSTKTFYDSLYASIKWTQKLISIINILKLMAKSRFSLKFLSQQEKMINILLEYINYHSKAPISRCAVTNILHKIADNDKGIQILFKHENYTRLHNYFTKCKEREEYYCRMKVYSILTRFNSTAVLPNPKLNIDLCLPDNVLQMLKSVEDKEDSESEADSDDSSKNDSDDSCSTIELRKSPTHTQIICEKPFLNMKRYFSEYYTDSLKTIEPLKFQIFENKGIPLSKYIQDHLHKSSNIGGIAFPDAAMLPAESYTHIVEVPEFPLNYLIEKLKQVPDSVTITYPPIVVFDLDEVSTRSKPIIIPNPNIFIPVNDPAQLKGDGLQFESRFESGNLHKATRVEEYEYDLILSPDTMTCKGFQWFYFQVSNMISDLPYTFNIINFAKEKNSYNEGMLPVVFSATNYALNKIGWRRTAGKVIFHGNHYTNESGRVHFNTLTFTVIFPYICDYVYIAYHYPYTYTRLMVNLASSLNLNSTRIYMRVDKLCGTVTNANEIPLLTITGSPDHPESYHIPFHKRPVVFLTARVHPGETNASWIMEGIINLLLSESNPFATVAREYFIFKIIPMLNPEGVIHGNTRHGLTGVDLNRCWSEPDDIMCPEIYFPKKLIEYAKSESNIPIASYIDIHGHSQQKFFFFYGCNPKTSWNSKDHQKGDLLDVLEILPRAIQSINTNIHLSSCIYDITKSREKTGRVVMWRELGITHSYTLECSYSEGFKKQSITTQLLIEIGESIIIAMGKIADKAFKAKQSVSSFSLDYSNIDNWGSNWPSQLSSKTNNSAAATKHIHYYFRF